MFKLLNYFLKCNALTEDDEKSHAKCMRYFLKKDIKLS